MTDAKITFPPRLPDEETTDIKAAYPAALFPEAGFATALSAMAYLATGSDWFAGATQQHERDECATRDFIFAVAAWQEVETNLHHYFPSTIGMLAAMDTLQNLLEGGQVAGIAKPIGCDRSEKIEPFQFADWERSWEPRCGLILIPGYWDLKVDAAALRRSRPAPPPQVEATRGTKFYNMADKLRPVFKDRFDYLAGMNSDHARAVYLAKMLGRSLTWKGRAPDIKTLKAHWDHYDRTRID